MDLNSVTPYEMLGGDAVVRAIVDRFYRLMDEEETYGELRALHEDDLSGVRAGLTEFLSAWLGGPKTWFDRKICMMSLHRPLPITPEVARQWSEAMARAISDQPDVDEKLAVAMTHRLMDMAMSMVNE
ncbi:MAG: globin [Sphingobium sp.]|nr:globin [Sphingobium sp.]